MQALQNRLHLTDLVIEFQDILRELKSQVEKKFFHFIMGKDLNGFQQCSVLKLQLRVQRKRHYCSRFFFLISSVKKNQTEEKARSSLLFGDVLKCSINHLAARMIKEKFLEEHPFLESGNLLRCEPDDHHFSKASIPTSSSNHPFPQIILVLQCGMELNQFHPPDQQRRPFPSRLSSSSSMIAGLKSL